MSDQAGAFDASLVVPGSNELAKDTNWWGAFVIGLSGTILILGLAEPAWQHAVARVLIEATGTAHDCIEH